MGRRTILRRLPGGYKGASIAAKDDHADGHLTVQDSSCFRVEREEFAAGLTGFLARYLRERMAQGREATGEFLMPFLRVCARQEGDAAIATGVGHMGLTDLFQRSFGVFCV
jgi:hypothetical protein